MQCIYIRQIFNCSKFWFRVATDQYKLKRNETRNNVKRSEKIVRGILFIETLTFE